MALPDNCELIDGCLVFWELAHPDTLSNEEGVYEYACFNACTNAFKPKGPLNVTRFSLPELAEDEVLSWGGRTLTSPEASHYRVEGLVLAALRLPVEPMRTGFPVTKPPGHGRPEATEQFNAAGSGTRDPLAGPGRTGIERGERDGD